MFNVLDYDAVGDSKTKNTEAIHKAIAACAKAGGGTVWFPAGNYLTGAIMLWSNVRLFLDAGATILGSQDPADYPLVTARWEGEEGKTHASLINGKGLECITITGRGKIDGQGEPWWQMHRKGTLRYPRPRLIDLVDCQNVLLEGVTLTNSPSWTVHPVYCNNLTIRGLTIRNPADSPNTDGINPDSCCNVRISDCYVDVGDDCITIKSGKGEEARRLGRPCENITISNCTMIHGHGGVVIGSEMSGGVRNIVISNCVFDNTDRGIRIKSQRGRGGVVEDIRVSNIVMRDVLCPFVMNLYYSCGTSPDEQFYVDENPLPVDEGTPIIRNIHFNNVTARRIRAAAGFLHGLPEMPIEGITFDNVILAASDAPDLYPGKPAMMHLLEPMTCAGFFCAHVQHVEFHNMQVETRTGPALIVEKARDVEIDGFKMKQPHADAPVIDLREVNGALIRGCSAARGTNAFLRISGAPTRGILLSGNDLGRAKESIALKEGARVEALL